MFREILTIEGGNNIPHAMTGKCGRSVKAGQVHRDQLSRRIEGHARTVVYQVVDNVRCFAAADIRGSAVVGVVKREGTPCIGSRERDCDMPALP